MQVETRATSQLGLTVDVGLAMGRRSEQVSRHSPVYPDKALRT